MLNTKKYFLKHYGWGKEGNIWPLLSAPSIDKTRDEKKSLSEKELSTFLMYAIGLLRFEILHVWALHRGSASARCLYPTDLYITIPACSSVHLDAGIYYYDPYHHALLKVRAGDWSLNLLQNLL